MKVIEKYPNNLELESLYFSFKSFVNSLKRLESKLELLNKNLQNEKILNELNRLSEKITELSKTEDIIKKFILGKINVNDLILYREELIGKTYNDKDRNQ